MNNNDHPAIHVVILAGGRGTRFWPASRRAHPKQFLAMAGAKSLLTTTCERLEGWIPADQIWIVTAAEHTSASAKACPSVPRDQILGEPCGRNTLPAIALASAHIARRDPHAIQVILPADHIVAPTDGFQALLQSAVQLAHAQPKSLITLGIRPTHPATGFGWIELGPEIDSAKESNHRAHNVQRFVEKPDLERATEYLQAGTFLWNSGMFIWSTAAIDAALKEHAPETWKALTPGPGPDDLEQIYEQLPSESIDTGILEKAHPVLVFPADLSWSDVGSWESLTEVVEADSAGNHTNGGGQILTLDAKGCLVHAPPETLTALMGVENLVVVRSGNAVLVAARKRGQDVRQLVELLESQGPQYL